VSGEAIETFPCFGGVVSVIVMGPGPGGSAAAAAGAVKRRLLEWHDQFSRFEPASELSQLNADPRETVPVSPLMARFVAAAIGAAQASGGLVDPTLADEIEAAGYRDHFEGEALSLERALALAPDRAPGGPSPAARWRSVAVADGVVTRPPGVRLDSGGIAKGLFGDVLAGILALHESFAIDAAGDVRLGGAGAHERPVQVASPFADEILHVFSVAEGAVATSGIGRRSWLDADGRPAHHLLDPASGRPAFTGIVQASALAPSGVEAEWRAKAALLGGPGALRDWLPHGGLAVHDDGAVELVVGGG